jgi:hypothetical protein
MSCIIFSSPSKTLAFLFCLIGQTSVAATVPPSPSPASDAMLDQGCSNPPWRISLVSVVGGIMAVPPTCRSAFRFLLPPSIPQTKCCAVSRLRRQREAKVVVWPLNLALDYATR